MDDRIWKLRIDALYDIAIEINKCNDILCSNAGTRQSHMDSMGKTLDKIVEIVSNVRMEEAQDESD